MIDFEKIEVDKLSSEELQKLAQEFNKERKQQILESERISKKIKDYRKQIREGKPATEGRSFKVEKNLFYGNTIIQLNFCFAVSIAVRIRL